MNRREFMKLSALTAGAVMGVQALNRLAHAKAGSPETVKGLVSDAKVKAMSLNISYDTQIINPPKGGKKVEFWIPLPQSDDEQEITRLSVDAPVAFHINEEPVYGNKMIHVGPTRLKGEDKITLQYKIRRKTVGTLKLEGEDKEKHLVLTEREKWDNQITMFVDQVVSNEEDPLEIGRKVYYALVDLLTYDKKIPGCGMGISVWTFKNKRGRCDDFHALFRTMMIRKGIPVKWEQGIPLPYPSVLTKSGKLEGDCTGSHCWVRFYVGNDQWVPVDISEADKREDMKDYFFGTLSSNRFKVSSGRNIILKPKQGGEPLNTFPYTHGENSGIPLIYGHHFRNEIRYELLGIEA